VPALGASGGVLLDRIRHIVGVSEAQDRMPRIHAWPIVLIAAAFVLLAWRQQMHPTLPTVQTIAKSLIDAPAQALAVVTGTNVAPIVESAPAAPTTATTVPDASPAPVQTVKIERPHVVVAKAEPLNRVRNLIAPTPMSTPELQLAEPEPGVEGFIAKRAALHIVPPVYPPQAMTAGIEGKVELSFQVNADGLVSDIRTVAAKPAGVFDGAARAALSEWRFEPSHEAGRRSQTFAFTLHAKNTDEKCMQPTGTMICRRPGE
jgi:bla regulator protein blaR1